MRVSAVFAVDAMTLLKEVTQYIRRRHRSQSTAALLIFIGDRLVVVIHDEGVITPTTAHQSITSPERSLTIYYALGRLVEVVIRVGFITDICDTVSVPV